MRIALLLVCFIVPAWASSAQQTDIDQYVQAQDTNYRWQIVQQSEQATHTFIVAELVSQQWLTKQEVDRPVWHHWLSIVIPKQVKSDVGLLWIGGGSNLDPAPETPPEHLTRIALTTGTVAAELGMVPNQPLEFHGDGNLRYEDDLIAYGWDRFLDGEDSKWLARNAMVKSAVKGMDAVTEIAATQDIVLAQYTVAGGSKRGWTTWLTGAMDNRVIAIAPIVIDIANVSTSMLHHFEAYGFWAVAIGDYVDHQIMQRFKSPRLETMYDLIDPLQYLHRLHLPKLILNASGDQFFLPDSSQFYWDKLRGEAYLRYVPNADHSLAGSDAIETVAAFQAMVSQRQKPPHIDWNMTEGGTLQVMSDRQPVKVQLWQAYNPRARDFRLEMIGPAYQASPVNISPDGLYRVKVQTPEQGWKAYFVELTYDVGVSVPLKLTTPIQVLPDILPFAGKAPDAPASVTLVCTPGSREAAEAVSSAVAASLQNDNALAGELRTQYMDGDLYVNWTPAGRLYSGFEGARKTMALQECEQLRVQLESGPGITLPPDAQHPDQ
ncbi:MAG: PhoPQ-activated protein PqaA family protein [Alcanivoracaceae bacterium]|jgi:PhoPQ-activated pathogenicity-related protein|nr:PhoPQ-activated protein PqaA family protein [Alcanivoracaceae bacterium]